MFVTSDIFGFDNSLQDRSNESLVCGIAVHGLTWPGYQAAAKFIVEAGACCGILGEMQDPGYNHVGAWFTNALSMEDFERLTRGEFEEVEDVHAVSLKGFSDVQFGGGVTSFLPINHETVALRHECDEPSQLLIGYFVFPMCDDPVGTAIKLFKLSVDMIDADYGYYFVRDERCFPSGYPWGLAPPLGRTPVANADAEEIRRWAAFANDGKSWSDKPMLRDLYEVNLLSARFASEPIDGLGCLNEWIVAGSGRGRLEDVGGGRLVWILTDAEIFNVRPLLNRAGILLSCLDRIYRDLP